jgi:hypothetical protein
VEFSVDDWQRHYGPLWLQFRQRKQRFDRTSSRPDWESSWRLPGSGGATVATGEYHSNAHRFYAGIVLGF